METVSLSTFESDTVSYVEHVAKTREHLIVAREGTEPVIVLPLGDYDGIDATEHLMSSPANKARLMESIRQIEAGNYTERELIDCD